MVPVAEFPPTMPLTVQVTAVLAELATVAVNCCVAPSAVVAVGGAMLTVTGGGGGGGGGGGDVELFEPPAPQPVKVMEMKSSAAAQDERTRPRGSTRRSVAGSLN